MDCVALMDLKMTLSTLSAKLELSKLETDTLMSNTGVWLRAPATHQVYRTELFDLL